MGESLLQKTRRLNRLLQNTGTKPVSFSEVTKTLSEVLEANVYIASRKGKVLGFALSSKYVLTSNFYRYTCLPSKKNHNNCIKF